jgi:hypothetical protein
MEAIISTREPLRHTYDAPNERVADIPPHKESSGGTAPTRPYEAGKVRSGILAFEVDDPLEMAEQTEV